MVDVLIVGAGPTGLTLAIELLRRGVGIRLIDAAEKRFEGSRGKGVQPRSLEIFDMMGVVDDVLEESSLYQKLKIHAGPVSFTKASLGTKQPATEERPYPNLMMVAQWRTELALRRKLEALGGQIEYNVALQSVSQGDREVTAVLTNGETVKASFLAGCDGGKSVTRKSLGLSLVGKTLDGKTMIVADLELEGDLDRNFWHVWVMGAGGSKAFAPLPCSNLWQLQAHENIAAKSLEQGVFKTTGRQVKKIAWQSRFRHQSRMVERYRVGRVFLAGDAAHIHPPSGAQGLNTGIQDAWNLGWKLVAALRTGDDAILDSYEAERLPVAADMLNLTKTLHVNASTKRGELTNQLSLGYRDSPLSMGTPVGELHPGDRIPDQRLPDGRRLLEAMRHGGAMQLMSATGLYALIRPDGHIAEFSTKPRSSFHGLEVVPVETGQP